MGGVALTQALNNARLAGGYECECGYLMVREGNEHLRCANAHCKHYAATFKLPVWPLLEVEAS